jgi:hypothetical protein
MLNIYIYVLGHSHSSALPRGVGMAIEVLFSSSPSCQDQPRVGLMSLSFFFVKKWIFNDLNWILSDKKQDIG